MTAQSCVVVEAEFFSLDQHAAALLRRPDCGITLVLTVNGQWHITESIRQSVG
jgi:hypothetical protein